MNNNLKAIVRHYANLKFWFAAWNKEKDAATAGQIRHAIKTIKRMFEQAKQFDMDFDDKLTAAQMQKEMSSIEAVIA